MVVNERRIALGRYRPADAATDRSSRVGDVMEPGPTTVRAHEPLLPLLERMTRRGVAEVIVTTPEGELLGVLHRPKENQ